MTLPEQALRVLDFLVDQVELAIDPGQPLLTVGEDSGSAGDPARIDRLLLLKDALPAIEITIFSRKGIAYEVGIRPVTEGISKEELDYMDIPNIDTVYEHGITEADARYLALNDIKIVENELCKVHPCVEDLDAVRQLILMDMAFNMGVPRLCKFKKMWAAIEEQRFDIASIEMMDSRWA